MNERQSRAAGLLLRKGEWFAGLPSALQDCILCRASLQTYTKGQVLQVEDRPSLGLIAVLEGQVALLRDVGGDDPVLMHVGGPGLWFGEIGVLMDDAPIATAVAQSPVRALVLPKAEFDRIVADEPRYYPAFARIVLERYRLYVRFLAETVRLSPDHRLRLRLADLADLQRTRTTADGTVVVLDLSQAELAAIIGLSRQKLNRRLRGLQDEGWVELAPRRIRVLDPDGLRASAAAGLSPRRLERRALDRSLPAGRPVVGVRTDSA